MRKDMKYIFTAIVCIMMIAGYQIGIIFAKIKEPMTTRPNQPVGIARGIYPGRVVWVHDSLVAKWDGTNGYWWDEANTSQTEVNKMLYQSLISLTGTNEEKTAWDKLFRHFNKTKKNIDEGYKANQKIAIKINENNTSDHTNNNNLNATPQLVYSILASLIKEGGVPQRYITVFDASRSITDNVFNKCHSAFPDVVFVDNIGGDGRIKSTYIDNAIPYSVDNGKIATGLATCAVEADYIINMALLKGHVGQGVTLCAKNYYGVTSINKDYRKNAHNGFSPAKDGKPTYKTFTDFLGHKHLGEKTMLFMIDGFYGSKEVNGMPKPKLQMPPFNNHWAASLFVSQDGVAIDAVGLDVLCSEWPDMQDVAYCDQYLQESALADNPLSGTFYDPERDGIKCVSLGVFEHWNNSVAKKYSRNLGKNNGIELFYVSLNSSK